jgi:hypothetical protein
MTPVLLRNGHSDPSAFGQPSAELRVEGPGEAAREGLRGHALAEEGADLGP